MTIQEACTPPPCSRREELWNTLWWAHICLPEALLTANGTSPTGTYQALSVLESPVHGHQSHAGLIFTCTNTKCLLYKSVLGTWHSPCPPGVVKEARWLCGSEVIAQEKQLPRSERREARGRCEQMPRHVTDAITVFREHWALPLGWGGQEGLTDNLTLVLRARINLRGKYSRKTQHRHRKFKVYSGDANMADSTCGQE